MEQRAFVRRRGGPVRRPSRRNGPPRFLWLLLALAVIAGVAALVWFLNKGSGDDDSTGSAPDPSSQAVSPAPEDGPSSAQESPAPTPAAALPDQLSPDSEPSDAGGFMIAGGRGYDYYHFNEETYELTGERTNKVYKLGQMVSVVVADADKFMRTIDFVLPEQAEEFSLDVSAEDIGRYRAH